MRPHRTRPGLAIVAGLVSLWPATTARAQYSYGYDSLLYGQMPAQSYYSASGYSAIYTDPSTGDFAGNSVASPKVVAPYQQPPEGAFGRRNGLNYQYTRPTVVNPELNRTPATKRRRGLFVRSKTRR